MTTSQSFADWSIDAETTKSPQSWYATSHTGPVCSASVCTHFACANAHTFTVASPDPVTRCEPRGEKSTELSQSLCPSPDMISSP